MVILDSRFVLDCARRVPSAVARYEQLRESNEPLYLSTASRAAVIAHAAYRDEALRRQATALLRSMEGLDIDSESIRCAAEIARELAREGRRLDGVDLFVAAGARQHGQVLVSRNASFERVSGLVRQPY